MGFWAEMSLDKEKQLPTSALEYKKQSEEWTFQPDSINQGPLSQKQHPFQEEPKKAFADSFGAYQDWIMSPVLEKKKKLSSGFL